MKSIEGQIRVARSALEMRIAAKIEPEHAVMTWLIVRFIVAQQV